MKYDEDYSVLLNLYAQLVNSQDGKAVDPDIPWHHDAQGISFKLFRHLATMRAIADGSIVQCKGTSIATFVDNSSLTVVARAAWETYLVFFYIYGGSGAARSEFRHKTWLLSGLTDRQKSHASTKDARETQALEKNDIERLRCEIAALPEFNHYTDKQQKKLLEGQWKTGINWRSLAVNAGFDQKYFDDVYSYLCGYSHTNYISVLQVEQAPLQAQQMLAESVLSIGVVIMAHFAFTYSAFFTSARAILENDTKGKDTAEMWRCGADDMAAARARLVESGV